MRVVIYLTSGKTFSFECVTDLQINEKLISFHALSHANPLGVKVAFYTPAVAGISCSDV